MNFNLSKKNKLKSKKDIDLLFSKGKSLRKGPLRLVYIQSSGPNKVGFVAPKRFLKTAVDRNRVKRLMREAYRLNQSIITTKKENGIHLMFIYQSPKVPLYKKVERNMSQLLKSITPSESQAERQK